MESELGVQRGWVGGLRSSGVQIRGNWEGGLVWGSEDKRDLKWGGALGV